MSNEYKQKAKQNYQSEIVLSSESTHQDLLPSANQLEEYEKVQPGSADIILKAFESESKHRQEIELIKTKTACRLSTLGTYFGFITALSFIILSGFLVYYDYEISGLIIGVSAIFTLAGLFIYFIKRRKK